MIKERTAVRKFGFLFPMVLLLLSTTVSNGFSAYIQIAVRTNAGTPISGSRIYVFNHAGSYLGLYQLSDAEGKANFDLDTSSGIGYLFRLDYRGGQFWSKTFFDTPVEPVNLVVDEENISVVVRDLVDGLPGVRVYLFTETGNYLGVFSETGDGGRVSFFVPVGMRVKFRADYLGYQFWSEITPAEEDAGSTLLIPHQSVIVSVKGGDGNAEQIQNARDYLFSPSGSYLGRCQMADDYGQVSFMLPEAAYKVRVDYLGRQYWSGVFTWQDTAVTIPFGDAEVIVTGNGQAIENTRVYVFSDSGAYLGVSGKTGENGRAVFHLPSAPYRFRADYQGNQYWSEDIAITPDNNTLVPISSGGGKFNLSVLKPDGVPLCGAPCYVFNDQGTYLGISGRTDGDGQTAFSLAEGIYKIRVDYLGYQFWSNTYSVPEKLSDSFVIPHQNAAVTVVGLFQTEEPIPAARVYLFSESGAYMGQSQISDTEGQVLFSLPDREYKVRVDYLGYQFWSDKINDHENRLTVKQGIADVHATSNGKDLSGARIYLFSHAGAYLGRHELTDGDGRAQFLLPDRAYKFRVDDGGDQVWSDTVQIVPGAKNNLHVELSPLAVSISADLMAVQLGGSVFLTWHSTGADSCVITPAVGSVSLSGFCELNPTSTTTYIITATGPAGSATSSVTVGVSYSMEIDTDADGMPDGWEAAHGLDPLTKDAYIDPDGDGLNSLFEYENGSFPDDSGSVPNVGNYYQYNNTGRIKRINKLR